MNNIVKPHPAPVDSTAPKPMVQQPQVHSTLMQQGYQQLAQYQDQVVGNYLASNCTEPTMPV